MGTKSSPDDDEEVLQLSEAIIRRVKWSYKSLLERRGLKMLRFFEKFGKPPFPDQSMRTVGKMCQDLAIGVLRALFEKAPVRQGRFGAKFAKRQLFFDTQIFLFRIQKVIFGIHTAVRQGFNIGFCQSKCSVVFSFGVFSSTFQVGPIDHCQRPVKHTNCLPVTFTRAKLVRPWKSPCRKSMGLVSSQCKELFWYKPWSREIPDCLHEI